MSVGLVVACWFAVLIAMALVMHFGNARMAEPFERMIVEGR